MQMSFVLKIGSSPSHNPVWHVLETYIRGHHEAVKRHRACIPLMLIWKHCKMTFFVEAANDANLGLAFSSHCVIQVSFVTIETYLAQQQILDFL